MSAPPGPTAPAQDGPEDPQAGPSRPATIDDVAKSAGVSRQTVSRAINDKPEIDPATRDRVLSVARAMGYRPSRFARGLASRGVTTVGLVIADVLNPFFPEVVAGVMDAADERGWQVAVYSTGAALEREMAVTRALTQHVDACVAFLLDERAVDQVRAAGIPVVLLDHDRRQAAAGGVRIDFASGIRQAIGHLIERGHRHLAMFDDGARPDADSAGSRHRLFLEVATEYGLPARESWVVPCGNSLQGGAQAMDLLVQSRPEVTAVLAYNDLIGIGAMRRAREHGRSVPDDCAFVGCDGLMLGELVDPPLTTLYIDKRHLGRAAVRQLDTLLSGKEPAETVIVPRLVVRASS
ncbi:LacI family DNA-binding transcriptional regulator [Streptomyces phyllanthi]|uniref:LacI family transcriptional regulator n=1 Tax=Streptomyces phyllanthi TaxID=1803180 RepID=A0A5N8WHQ5_9ACTN|nr:LacI family DNA-binding transcriptional regulator [Streptomyces phyllanthi]MPY46048.1 LacI family transcriptional regulator [Streptomyces phyllanthi]